MIIKLLMAAMAAAPLLASAQEKYAFKEEQIGSHISRAVAFSYFPLDKKWSEMTSAQQKVLRDSYESMPAADEPPYPLLGVGPMVQAVARAHRNLHGVGQVTLVADVDAEGNATAVSATKSELGPELVQYAGMTVMLTKFKPALCQGQPCKMQFPMVFTFE